MEASDQQKNLSKYNIILCLDNKNCEIHVLKFVLKRKLRGKEMMNRIYKNPRRLVHCHRERRLYYRKSSSHLTISRKTERRWKEYQGIDFYLSLKDEMPWNIVRSSKPAFPTSPKFFSFCKPRLFREPFVLRSDCRDPRGIPPLFARIVILAKFPLTNGKVKLSGS